MLFRLAFHTGGLFDGRSMLFLACEHEGFSPHFDPERQLSTDRWRLLYLARYGRVGPDFFERMGTREVDAWVEELSEMLQAEAGKKRPAPGGEPRARPRLR